jgi:hypothetical protein
MIFEMTRMSTYPHFYFPIELFLRLELVIFHSNLFMGYIRCYVRNICYHPNQDEIMIQHLLEF